MRMIPLVLVLGAPVAGVALGLMLAPSGGGGGQAADPPADTPPLSDGGANAPRGAQPPDDARDYVRIGRQIIIPIIKQGETSDLMMFDLALDIPAAEADRARLHEPKIRDAFLEVLLRLANTGAFDKTYTDRRVLEEVREELRAAARHHLGSSVRDVLILDVIRQAV